MIPASQISSGEKKRFPFKWILATLGALVLATGIYFAPKNLFRANLTEGASIGSGDIYIDTHTGLGGGELNVRVKNDITSFDAIAFDLTFPAGDLIFPNDAVILDQETLLQPADVALKLTAATDNKITVTVLLSDPVSIDVVDPLTKATHPILFKLQTEIGDAGAGENINIDVENFGTFLGVNDLGLTMSAANVIVSSSGTFEVERAEVLAGGTQVLVHTNDLIGSLGGVNDYKLSDGINPSFNPSAVNLGSDMGYGQDTIVLTLAAPLTGDKTYTVQLNPVVLGNSKGSLADNKSMAIFVYPSTFNTTVTVESVVATSSTKFEITFSDAITANTLTPINLKVFKFNDDVDLTDRTNLTLSNVAAKTGNTYTITTSPQEEGAKYFVQMLSVKDADNDLLTNQTMLSFDAFAQNKPVVLAMTPTTLNTAGGNLVLSGSHLDQVASVKMGNVNLNFSGNANTLTLTIPANLPLGNYPISLVWQGGTIQAGNLGIQTDANANVTQIVSSQSKSIPSNVRNDGFTQAKVWVLVQGLDADDYTVTIDLSQLNGNSSQLMQKDSGVQSNNGQWYVASIVVPKTVATQSDPYLLPVKAVKGNSVLEGTASVRVTADILGSVAPEIIQAYLSPVSVAPDGKTVTHISARVEDEDGAPTITSVVADLGTAGLGFIPLTSANCTATEGQELTTCFYQSADFTVPLTTAEGNYTVSVIATDSAGNTASKSLSLTVTDDITGPTVSNLTLSSRSAIPNDGSTEFSLFATISDPDGLSDVNSVVAYPSIDSDPIVLKLAEGASSSGKTGLYSATKLTIPTTAFTGTHTFNVEATDASGLVGNATIDFSVTNKDTLGEPPRVLEEKAYTTPQSLANDGATPGTLYVPIEDRDGDITQVIVNLASVNGKQGVQTQSNLTESKTSSSSTTPSTPPSSSTSTCSQSPQVPCLQLAFREGDIYWYILKDFTIPSTTPSRLAPYYVEVIVSDKLNKTDTGSVPIVVSDGVSGSSFEPQLKAKAAIPTSMTTVEIVFNQEVDSTTVNKNLFEILDMNNSNNKLPIVQASINATNRIVTLTTAEQLPLHPYVVNFKEGLSDSLGQPLIPGGENRVGFKGFSYLGKVPNVQFAEAVEGSRIQMEFDIPLKASTLPLGGPDFSQIKIYEEKTLKPLRVLGVNMLSDKTVELVTEAQKSGQRYVVEMSGVRSYDGVLIDLVKKVVKGVGSVSSSLKKVAGTADLDADGDVDFADFTLFSSVYGSTY